MISTLFSRVRREDVFLFLFFGFCLLFSVGAGVPLRGAAASGLSIDDIRFGQHPDKTRLVLELSAPAEFRAFVLPAPWRLVVDMPALSWRVPHQARPAGTGIRDIRHGAHGVGISRVVFDLDSAVDLQAAFVLSRADGRPDRLVIDYARISPAAFPAVEGKRYGSFSGSSANPPPPDAAPVPAAASFPPRRPHQDPVRRKPVIIIDPGHGGRDPGAIAANGVFEKNITLAIGHELRKQLESTGRYTVKMTRTGDTFLHLRERVAFARDNGGDLFLSIHADSIGNSGVRGASVYTLSDTASDSETAKLAERENRAGLVMGMDLEEDDTDVAFILVDLAMRESMNESRFLAGTLVGAIQGGGIPVLPNPHRYAGFAVLKAPDIPSILVECGFMSNRHEADLLTRPEYRRKLAGSLVRGVDAYFERVRRNQGI